MNFDLVKSAVAKQFERMQQHQLFVVDADKAQMWVLYLNSFKDGTNPIYRVRTDHDCSCCRNFIRDVGNVVAIIDNQMVSIWDVMVPEYQPVLDAMSRHVKAHSIVDLFFHYNRTVGTDKSFEEVVNGTPKTWNHFFVNVHSRFVMKKKDIPTKLNEARSARDVFVRSLTEITDDAVETVLDLISQNSLYRGEEHKALLTEFKKSKTQYSQVQHTGKVLVGWSGTGAVARIRNTVIGTLLQDLSEGKEIDIAVRAYESKVAPMNYKRPTALITKAMIEKAKETLAELGLTSALERRYATLKDITINNVLFANRNTKKEITGTIFDTLTPTSSTKAANFDKVETVSIDKFVTDILPRVDSIEILMEGKFTGNLVSLIAPADATALPLFKWPNKFSWTYNGDVADSIKERVKKAGGNINADLCCRLAWYNYDDLDLHLKTPQGEIYFGRKNLGGGRLDVDMNAGGATSREAVENIFYQDRKTMVEGEYELFVQQYRQRETIDVGFEVEIDYLGNIQSFVYDKAVVGDVTVAKFTYTKADGIKITKSLPSSQVSKTVWGLQTQTFQPVSALLLSPNYWDDNGVGNKHYFFMLEGCTNDGTARGFYNEFLKSELDKHRKVLEVIGSKMKAGGPDQLSGLGFSSTQKNTLVCRVKGSFSRTLKVQF